MGKVILIGVAILLVLLAAGAAYLAFVDVPAPTVTVEKVLPDGQFPK
jgi:hypothetical protein